MREELIASIAREVAAFQDATDLVDEAVAERLGINRTDLRCLGLLVEQGPLSAGQLAGASGLSPGAMTAALDRLARAGHARRVRDPADRRRIMVEVRPQARRLLSEAYAPIGQAGRAVLARHGNEELAVLHDFLRAGRALQVEHAARIRAGGASPATPSPPPGPP